MSTRPRFQVTNATRSVLLARDAERADRFLRRAFGLMGRAGLDAGGGMIIEPCNSVTCFFMRFPIDVVFVDREGTVRHVIEGMKPWRSSRMIRGSRLVVELPAGTARATNTAVGDHLEFSPV